MALHSLGEIRGLKDPLKQSQIEFIITEVPGLVLAKLSQKVAGALSGNKAVASAKELRLRCTSYSYPGAKIEQTETIISGFRKKVATIQNRSGIWRCKITEDYEGSILTILQAWMDLQHSPILGTRVPSLMYMGTAQIIIGGGINTGGRGKLGTRTIWLKNFYPIEYRVNDIDPSSSNPVDIDVSFNYDYFADNSYSVLAQFG